MRSTDKLDTIKIFENLVETSSVKPDFTAEVLDGAAVVQVVASKNCQILAVLQERVYCIIQQILPEYPKPF